MHESREEIVALVKERADIVQVIGENVDLKKSGARYLGLCPFHGEKTPSFSVHSGQQFFHCFGCGESGDVFSFLMKYHNLDFPAALKQLADRYSIQLPEKKKSPEQERRERLRQQMFAINLKTAELYRQHLLASGQSSAVRKYLESRGIPEDIQEMFGLGCAPSTETAGWDFLVSRLSEAEKSTAQELGLIVKKERGGHYDRFRDRVLFPIYEVSGRVCGFGGRIIGEGQPKYMNSPESAVFNKSRLLLGLYQQKENIRKQNQAIVVEGNFDLISLACHGCDNVVAPLGTAMTREQLRLLKRYAEDVVLLFDGDSAGIKAAVRAVPLFLAEQMAGRVALLPSGHDPDSYIREFGVTAVHDLVDKAETLPEFVFAHFVKEYGLTLDGKGKIVEELRPLVKSATSALQRSVIIAHFAEQLGLSAGQLDGMLEKSREVLEERPPDFPPDVPPQMPEAVAPLSAAQKRLVDFMVLNPSFFSRLEEGGLRYCLEGGIGEILLLQMKEICNAREVVEPEELLAVLPDGAEKELVMELLLSASGNSEEAYGELDAELEELLDWMKLQSLQRSSAEILKKINQVQVSGDFGELKDLLLQKQKIDRELQGLGE